MKMNLESHDFMRFKDMGLLKYYNLNLIEKQKDSNRPYLNRTQKTANSENLVAALNNDYVKILEKQKVDLEQKDVELKSLKQDNEKLKQQVEKLEKDIDNINRSLLKYQQTEDKNKKPEVMPPVFKVKLGRGRPRLSTTKKATAAEAQRNAVTQAKIKKLRKKATGAAAATTTCSNESIDEIITPRLSKLIAINSITHNNSTAVNLNNTCQIIDEISEPSNNKGKNGKSSSGSAKFINYDETSNASSSVASYKTDYNLSESSSVNNKDHILVPSWREKSFVPLYRIEGTENITDEMYLKRHQKFENEEKQIKKWDIRRQREEFERLKLLKGRQKSSNGTGNTLASNQNEANKPNINDVETIEIISETEMNELISKQQQTSMMSVYDDIDMDFGNSSSNHNSNKNNNNNNNNNSLALNPPPRKRAKNK